MKDAKEATNNKPAVPIRLIALDLDGTTLRSDKSVGQRTREALHAAHKKGVEVVLASGRMTPAMESTVDALELDVFLVSYNGAMISGPRREQRKRLAHTPLPADVARDLYLFGRQHKIQVNFYHEDVILTEDAPHLRPWVELYRSRNGSPFRVVDSLEKWVHHCPTKLLLVTEPETRNRLFKEMAPAFGKRACMVCSDPEYLEFLSPEICKGRGVARLAELRGIPLESVMGVGDGDNDLTMVQMSGWGVAVANASPQCKQLARATTVNDHNHDAVAEAIERWVL